MIVPLADILATASARRWGYAKSFGRADVSALGKVSPQCGLHHRGERWPRLLIAKIGVDRPLELVVKSNRRSFHKNELSTN